MRGIIFFIKKNGWSSGSYGLCIPALLLLLLFLPASSSAQYGAFRIGTDFPLRYTVGYTVSPRTVFSIQGNAGILTDPYDRIILRALSTFGADKTIIDIVENSFNFGTVFDLGGNFNIGRGYFGVYGQMIHLSGASAPFQLVGEFLGIDLSPFFQPGVSPTMHLQSNIYQAGLRVGTRVPLSHPNLELQAELSFSKNISSKSQITSETPYPAFINTEFNSRLRETYRKYLYIPAFGIFLVYYLH